MSKIWIIGGTRESAIVAEMLIQQRISAIVTVTTENAKKLYPIHPNLTIWVGKLTAEMLESFIREHHIKAVISASHPFAEIIAQQSIDCCTRLNIPYLRKERPLIHLSPGSNYHIPLKNYQELWTRPELFQEKKVLLTLGYKALPLFIPYQEKAYFFARILPSLESLQTALNCHFLPERIIAIRPPLTLELERALWQQWQIEVVITKASGSAGGEKIKQQLAQELNIPLIIIERPNINYPQITESMEDVLRFCQTYYRA